MEGRGRERRLAPVWLVFEQVIMGLNLGMGSFDIPTLSSSNASFSHTDSIMMQSPFSNFMIDFVCSVFSKFIRFSTVAVPSRIAENLPSLCRPYMCPPSFLTFEPTDPPNAVPRMPSNL